VLRRIQNTFNSAYITPLSVSKKAQQLTTSAQQEHKEDVRRDLDRRCDLDRRQQRRAILIDLRSPYLRRKLGRRSQENIRNYAIGIDVLA